MSLKLHFRMCQFIGSIFSRRRIALRKLSHYEYWFWLSKSYPDNESMIVVFYLTRLTLPSMAIGVVLVYQVRAEFLKIARARFRWDVMFTVSQGSRISGVPTAAISESFFFQGIPSLTMYAFGEAAPSLEMTESVVDLFSESFRTAANGRLPGVASENFGKLSVSETLNVECQGE